MNLDPEVVADLPRKQKAVVEYIRQNAMACAGLTLEQLADVLGVNASTIIRAAQGLGYKGFSDLRQDLRHQYLSTLDILEVFEANRARLTDGHPIAAQLRSDLGNMQSLIDSVDPAKVERLAQRIIQARSVLIASTGTFASLGLILSHLCHFIGRPVELENRGSTYLSHRLANLREDDLLIGITFWRGSRDVVQAIEWAHGQGIPTACITDSSQSRVSRASGISLIVPTESTSFFHSVTAATSLVYALVNAVWQQAPEQARRSVQRAQQLYLDFHLQAGDLDGTHPRGEGSSP